MLLSERVTFYMLLLIIFSLIASSDLELEIFFILTYLSLLFLREGTTHFASKKVKVRMNLFIVVGLIIFAWIMYERVAQIISNA